MIKFLRKLFLGKEPEDTESETTFEVTESSEIPVKKKSRPAHKKTDSEKARRKSNGIKPKG